MDIEKLPIVQDTVRYGIPIAGMRKFVPIGLNCFGSHGGNRDANPERADRLHEGGNFLAGPNDDVPITMGPTKIDWEVELGVVIGSIARYLNPGNAMAYVAGYVLVNDISDRVAQLERGGSWDTGKSHDGFGPVGPWFVTTNELGEARDLEMFVDVSGQPRQHGTTSRMIFNVPTVVSCVSQFMTLEPGDIIATGTPLGVAMGMRPPVFLSAGDKMHLGIVGRGEQTQSMVPLA